jgi:hypothetical protein
MSKQPYFVKLHYFGQEIGADLLYDGRFSCRVKLADGKDLQFFADGSIVVGENEWVPPTIRLGAIREDLKWLGGKKGKVAIESDPKKLLEFCTITSKWLQEYMEVAKELLKKSNQREHNL